MAKRAFDAKLEAIEAVRAAPVSEAAQPLRKALNDRNNFVVSKAAAAIAGFHLRDLAPDLAAAFDRFFEDPVKSDPKCWAKIAIAKALRDLGHDDAAPFIRGLKHIQMEPSYIRPEDTAVDLRAVCALTLAACALPRYEILAHLADALAADPAKPVRMDAARAIAQLSGFESILLLRLKARAGDPEAAVTGQCLASLLEISPQEYIPFADGFLDAADPDVRIEAAAAMGECHEPEAARALIRRFGAQNDPEVKRAMLLSLGASRHAEAAAFLLSIIENGPRAEAVAAIEALAAGRFRGEYRDRVRSAVEQRNETRLRLTYDQQFSGDSHA